jgi:histone chaperone ASF1
MAQVYINNIVVKNNPASVLSPFSFDIVFECFNALPGTFDWKIIYIGSPNNPNCDQTIDSFDMENLSAGVMQFNVESNPPDFNLIPQEEIIGTARII